MSKEENIVYHKDDDILCSGCSKRRNKIKKSNYDYSVELNDGIIVDLDKKGNVINIEVIFASKMLGVSRNALAKRFKVVK